MKKIITLMFAAALAAGAYADEFVSPGNGTVYTLDPNIIYAKIMIFA